MGIGKLKNLQSSIFNLQFKQLVAAGGLGGLACGLALLPLPAAFGLVGGLILVVTTLLTPVYGLYAVVLSVPIQELVLLPGGLTVTQVTVMLALAAWLLHVLAHPERCLRRSVLLAPWALFLWALLLSAIMTPYDINEGLKEWSRWVVALLTFVLALNTVTNRRQALGLIACVLVAPALTALWGLVQFVLAYGPPSYAVMGRFVRAYGTFGAPNPFAAYMNMAWPLAVMLSVWAAGGWLWQRGQAERPSLGVLLGASSVAALTLAGLLASFSRGAWVGALAGAVLLTLLAGRRAAFAVVTVTLLSSGVLLAAQVDLLPEAVRDRLASIVEQATIFDAGNVKVTPDNFAVVERMAHWQAGLAMINAYPVFGVGTGNFNLAYKDFFVDPWTESRGHAHNYYIHITAESGMIGLVAYLLLLGGMGAFGIYTLRVAPDVFWQRVALGVCGIIGAVVVHNMFENLHVLNMGIQLSATWALLALAAQGVGGQTITEEG